MVRENTTTRRRHVGQLNQQTQPLVPSPVYSRSDSHLWVPKFRAGFSCFCAIRLVSAAINQIADCDETFNYWEPAHYLQYGFGLQTWEYSPVYSLRSYLYVSIHALVGNIISFAFQSDDKVMIFYYMRNCLAIFSAFCETLFYLGVTKHFGRRVGRYTLVFLLCSSGMFHASTAFLPSTFTMCMIMLVFYAWFSCQLFLGVLLGVIAVIWGWPYVAVMFVPFAFDTLWKRGVVRSLLYGIVSLALVVIPEMAINYYYYRVVTLPAYNIVMYNVFGGGGGAGSELYGTEPWTFYMLNLFLNMNIIFPLAVPAIFLIWLRPILKFRGIADRLKSFRDTIYLLPMYVWFAVMVVQPHKEERFLFPIYPMFCLAAACSLAVVVELLERQKQFFVGRLSWSLVFGAVSCCALISASRVVSIYVNYNAPLSVYGHFYHVESQLPQFTTRCAQELGCNLCVGKEWYRFPTSYFLPTEGVHLRFLRSSFRGQLPKPFSAINGTSIIPTNMNDLNKEEVSRYISISECDYVVDLTLQGQTEHDFLTDIEWEAVYSVPFLDSSRSKSLYRAFYIPLLTPKNVVYASYTLFRKK